MVFLIASEANLNIRGVFLHVLADALGSVIVSISALLNKYSSELKLPESVIRFIDPGLW
jgi:Co/Zn/Cd efflux system component